MQDCPTTLSDVVRLISEVLRQHYGKDPAPLLEAAGIDPDRVDVSGARVQRDKVMLLWEVALAATNDPSIGLVVGSKIRSTSFFALGMGFLTSDNLRDALELLCRYYRIIVTVPLRLTLIDKPTTVELEIEYTDPRFPLPPAPFDSFIASILALCRLAATPDFRLKELRLRYPDNGRGGDYRALFNCPVVFGAQYNTMVFDRAALEAPLPGRSDNLLNTLDRVMADYVAALSPDEVSTEVRKLLLTLLPTGNASQQAVAEKLNMSRSTLQRRLQEENTSYKELREATRRSLALDYVRDGKYALAYVAYMLGFSDQSNFSRAFRRWTGKSPKAYRDELPG